MFFRKKDYRHYWEKGERMLAAQQFAEARINFQEALERLTDEQLQNGTKLRLQELLAVTGDHLAQRNLEEAESAYRVGDAVKTLDHLKLALTMADDVTLREKTEKFLAMLQQNREPVQSVATSHSCSGCSSSQPVIPVKHGITDGYLSDAERFDLLIQPLPSNLPSRYAALGEKFASAYLLSAEGKHEQSLSIYLNLTENNKNDITLYEAAVLQHQLGLLEECEVNLLQAYHLNKANPLCCIGLVQLYSETGRVDAAIEVLQLMLDMQVEVDQASLLMGDIYRDNDQADLAIDFYSRVLVGNASRSAAERIIPLLESVGRAEEAKALYKRYLKGCC